MSRRGFDWRREFERQHGYRPGEGPAPDGATAPGAGFDSAPQPVRDGVDETGLCIRTARGWRRLGGPMRPVPPPAPWGYFGGIR